MYNTSLIYDEYLEFIVIFDNKSYDIVTDNLLQQELYNKCGGLNIYDNSYDDCINSIIGFDYISFQDYKLMRYESRKLTEENYNKQCTIKGNRNPSTKEFIYHTIDSPCYNETKLNSTYLDLLFCTESEAQSYGFRKFDNSWADTCF